MSPAAVLVGFRARRPVRRHEPTLERLAERGSPSAVGAGWAPVPSERMSAARAGSRAGRRVRRACRSPRASDAATERRGPGRQADDEPAGRVADREQRRRAEATGLGDDHATHRDPRPDVPRAGLGDRRDRGRRRGRRRGLGVGTERRCRRRCDRRGRGRDRGRGSAPWSGRASVGSGVGVVAASASRSGLGVGVGDGTRQLELPEPRRVDPVAGRAGPGAVALAERAAHRGDHRRPPPCGRPSGIRADDGANRAGSVIDRDRRARRRV